MNPHLPASLIVLCFMLALCPAGIAGQSDIMEQMALRALQGQTGVGLVVVTLDDDLLAAGSASSIQQVMELELRRVGIPVGNEHGSSLALVLELTALPISGAATRYAVSYNGYAMQPVRTMGDDNPILAWTWLRSGVAVWGTDVVRNAARELGVQIASEFANAYLAANPR